MYENTSVGYLIPVNSPCKSEIPSLEQQMAAPEGSLAVNGSTVEQQIAAPSASFNIYSHLEKDHMKSLLKLLREYEDMFSKSSSDIGRTVVVKHNINTGFEPVIKQNLRRIPMHKKQEVKELLNDMLEREVIRPSNSPWSSPIVLVKKKDNTTRFCVDFRKVNEITKTRTQYPALMTRLIRYMVPDIFPVLIWPAAIGKLNCKKKKRKKTSFSMSYGLYEFNVMPFGHTGAPGLFKRLMENVLKGLQFEICLIYLDDVVIFSSSFNEHLQRLRLVFDRFRESGLKLKLTKCHFAGRSVKCLGHIVSDKGIMTDPDKIEVIRTWPQPTNARDVKSFLGLARYYRCFIKGFSTICSPLNKFLQKEESFSWSSKCDEAFQMLKSKLATAPILSYPTVDGIFTLDTDATSTSIGAVLSQRQGDSEKVICYASRMLTKSERN